MNPVIPSRVGIAPDCATADMCAAPRLPPGQVCGLSPPRVISGLER
jgi:hypothetical protein